MIRTPVERLLDAFAAAEPDDHRPCPRCRRPLWQCNCDLICVVCGQVVTKEEAATRIEPHLRQRREACSAHLR